MALANDVSHKAQKDKLWRKRLLQIKVSFEKYSGQLQSLIDGLQSPVTPATHPGPDGVPESSLMVRIKDIIRAMKTTMLASKDDLEDMVLTITMDPSAQLVEHSRKSNGKANDSS